MMQKRATPSGRSQSGRTAVTIAVAISACVAISGCTNELPTSSYDIYAADFAREDGSRCERYAYQTGRTRYEDSRSVTGQAFAKSRANRAAEAAFIRCQSGRVN